MSSLITNRKLTSLDEMFGSSRDDGLDIQNGLVQLVKIAQLKPRKNHTFRTNLGFKDDDLMLSIREFGVLEPIIVQPLDAGGYEILAGHRRTNAALLVGLTEIPAVIKDGLSEAEATIIETESNLLQRSWKDMSHSERAEVLNAHYNATNFRGVRNGFLDQISEEIKTLAKPVKSMAEDGLSPVGTKSNLRQSGDAYELSKNTVARYLRIYLLKRELKNRMDMDEISLRAGVELSYLSPENQQRLDELLDTYKLDIKKAQDLRRLEEQGKLTSDSMMEILIGKQLKKPGRPKSYKIQESIINKYFDSHAKQKEIEEVIDAALEAYFKERD